MEFAKSLFIVTAVISVITVVYSKESTRTVFKVDFEKMPLGSKWRGARGNISLSEIISTLSAKGEVTKAFKVTYVKGLFGKQSKVSYRAGLKRADKYVSEFDVKFAKGFDFKKTGKLGGLCGGKCTTGCKEIVPNGWSSRFTWKKGNNIYLYIYDQDRDRGNRADKRYCGTDYNLHFKAVEDEWITFRQELTINTPNKFDGKIKVLINGREIFYKDNFRFRGDTTDAQIDTFYFTTFFGGSNKSFAPSRNSSAYFDNFSTVYQPKV